MKHVLIASLFALSSIVGPFAGRQVAAQQAPSSPSALDVTPERLGMYTEAHVALEAARDAYHLELGRTHDVQGQARLRAEFSERSMAILDEHEIMQADYEGITAMISVDQGLRERFEALRTELTAGRGTSPG